MHTIKTLDGQSKQISRGTLERLRMLADWQIRSEGIEPISVNEACWKADCSNDQRLLAEQDAWYRGEE